MLILRGGGGAGQGVGDLTDCDIPGARHLKSQDFPGVRFFKFLALPSLPPRILTYSLRPRFLICTRPSTE